MDQSKKQQFRELFRKQPQHIQELINSEETLETLVKIGDKNDLNENQRGELGSETGRVLVGMTPKDQFVPNIMERLGVDQSTAEQIASDAETQILSRVTKGAPERQRDMSAVDKVLVGSAWKAKVGEIAERYGVSDTRVLEEIVENAVRANSGDISDPVARGLGITNEKSAKIADALRQKVLTPIKTYIESQATPEPIQKEAPKPVPTPESESTSEDEEYESEPQEANERLNRLQILRDIENPLQKNEGQSAEPKPIIATPSLEQSVKLAQPENPKKEITSIPQQKNQEAQVKSEPQPSTPTTPKSNPQPETPQTPSGVRNDLLSTIQQVQQKHGNIVDQKLGSAQSSKPAPKPEPTPTPNAYGHNDPYREPIE